MGEDSHLESQFEDSINGGLDVDGFDGGWFDYDYWEDNERYPEYEDQ